MDKNNCLEVKNSLLRGKWIVTCVYLKRLLFYGLNNIRSFWHRPCNLFCNLTYRHEREISVSRIYEGGAAIQFAEHAKLGLGEFGVTCAHFCVGAQHYAVYAPESGSNRHCVAPSVGIYGFACSKGSRSLRPRGVST